MLIFEATRLVFGVVGLVKQKHAYLLESKNSNDFHGAGHIFRVVDFNHSFNKRAHKSIIILDLFFFFKLQVSHDLFKLVVGFHFLVPVWEDVQVREKHVGDAFSFRSDICQKPNSLQ